MSNSISVGGNATGAFVAGDNNRIDSRIRQLRDVSTADLARELTALRSVLSNLNSPQAAKIGRALDDADEEVKREAPDKAEVGSAVERALRVAKEASDFAENTGKLLPILGNITAWLGTNWAQLMSLL